MMKKLLFILLFLALPASAEILTGKVVSVADGDTLTILAPGNRQVKVRLAHTDAPEKKQPFGQRAKQALSDMCYGVVAAVHVTGYDRYKRALGEVSCQGDYANAVMVLSGMAWVYRQYSNDPELLKLEATAQAQRRGLWSDPNPTPPWEFRRSRRR